MANHEISSLVNRLALSGDEITVLTKWADSMVTDYLGIHESLLLVAEAFDSLITFSAKPTEDAGDGSVEGDVNATDWTGHDHANGTRLQILTTENVIFGHKGFAYQYIGNKPALLGLGGDYVTVNSDFIPIGAGDHDVLNNRTLPDSHPISAITALQAALDAKADQTSLNAHTGDGTIHFTEASIDHANIQNIGSDTHSELEARLDTLETNIVELVPAGYGGGRLLTLTAFDIPTATYNTLPFDTLIPVNNRGVTFDIASNTFTFTSKGVWTMMIAFSLADHNNDNGGRVYSVRIYNQTQSIAGAGVVDGVGRNVLDTFFSIPFLVDVSQANVDNADAFRVEVGDADTAITGGDLVAASIQTTHSSELGALI